MPPVAPPQRGGNQQEQAGDTEEGDAGDGERPRCRQEGPERHRTADHACGRGDSRLAEPLHGTLVHGTDPTGTSNDNVYDLVMHVAAQASEIDELAQRLRAIVSAMVDR